MAQGPGGRASGAGDAESIKITFLGICRKAATIAGGIYSPAKNQDGDAITPAPYGIAVTGPFGCGSGSGGRASAAGDAESIKITFPGICRKAATIAGGIYSPAKKRDGVAITPTPYGIAVIGPFGCSSGSGGRGSGVFRGGGKIKTPPTM